MVNNREYQYTNIKTEVTTTVFSGKGTLHNVVVNTAATGGVVRIVDNNSGTTANVGLIASSTAGTYSYDVAISKGLIIDTGSLADITVCWTKG